MWYVVNPEEPTEFFNNENCSSLLQKFMLSAALHASRLDADQETQKAEEYCRIHKKKTSDSLSLACPDATCGSRPSTTKNNEKVLLSNLLTHWFTTKIHQETFHEQAQALTAVSKDAARRNFVKRKTFTVRPFPGKNHQAEEQEKRDSATTGYGTGSTTGASKSSFTAGYLFSS